MKLIPSVTRVFNKGRNLYVYLQAYQQPPATTTASAATPAASGSAAPTASTAKTASAASTAPAAATPSAQPLIAFVSFFQGGKKVFETQPEEVSPNLTTSLKMAPINFTVDLSQLAAGKYDCQVTVLDPGGEKSAFWQAPIMLEQ
jgi:hypothetical protein